LLVKLNGRSRNPFSYNKPLCLNALPPHRVTHSRIVILLLLFVLVWFAGLDERKLTRPDEGRYSEIPREMAVTGDWVTPRLNGLKYFEKPPLQYWATAFAYNTFGQHNWSARAWPALTGLFGLLLVFAIGRHLYGWQTAIAATAILASSLWYFAIAHVNTLDMGLTCWMTLTMAGFLFAERSEATKGERLAGMHAAWAGMALAMLSKGLIGIVLPGGVLLFYSLWQRDLRMWDRLHIGTGLLLFLAIVAPWFVWVQARNPEFGEFFFFHEHFSRFVSTGHRREGGWWYFVPILLGGMAPWTLLFLSRLRHVWAVIATPKPFHPERLLVVWCVFIFVFFSVSGSKLPSYIIPVFPALALLMAPSIVQTSPRAYAWNLGAAVVFALTCVAAMVMIDRFGSDEIPVELFENMRPWLGVTVAALLLGTLLALRWRRQAASLRPVLAVAVSGLIAWQGVAYGYNALSPATSSYHLVQQIEAKEGPLRHDVPFFSIRTYEQTLPFYLKRTLTLVDFYDELNLGLQQEPEKGLEWMPQFYAAWLALDAAYAAMKPEDYEALQEAGLPMRELGHDSRRVIVSRK
jgi:4-amino-4-deoxy-L-arabinose transferase-like glycosyltransferase